MLKISLDVISKFRRTLTLFFLSIINFLRNYILLTTLYFFMIKFYWLTLFSSKTYLMKIIVLFIFKGRKCWVSFENMSLFAQYQFYKRLYTYIAFHLHCTQPIYTDRWSQVSSAAKCCAQIVFSADLEKKKKGKMRNPCLHLEPTKY